MNKEEIKKLVVRAIDQHDFKKDVKSLRLFGSQLYGKPREDSDIDLLIEFLPESRVGFFRLVEMQNAIEQVLGKKIDLQTPEALSKYFRDDVLKKAEQIYER